MATPALVVRRAVRRVKIITGFLREAFFAGHPARMPVATVVRMVTASIYRVRETHKAVHARQRHAAYPMMEANFLDLKSRSCISGTVKRRIWWL